MSEHPEHLCKFCITGELQEEHTFEPALFGLWHGGGNYSRIGVQDDNVEVFVSVEDAAIAAWNRMHTGHHFSQHFALATGEDRYTLTPVVDETSEVVLFHRDPRETGEWTADITLVYDSGDDEFVTEDELESRNDNRNLEDE